MTHTEFVTLVAAMPEHIKASWIAAAQAVADAVKEFDRASDARVV